MHFRWRCERVGPMCQRENELRKTGANGKKISERHPHFAHFGTLSLGHSMAIGPSANEKTALSGQLTVGIRLARAMPAMIGFNSVEPQLQQNIDVFARGRQSRMPQKGQAARCMEGVNGFLGGGQSLWGVGAFPAAYESIEYGLNRLLIASRNDFLSDMDAPQSALCNAAENVGQVYLYAPVAQPIGNLNRPFRARGLLPGQQRQQGRMRDVHSHADDVYFMAIVCGADFHAWKKVHAVLDRRFLRGNHAGNGIVIGDGQRRNPDRRRAPDKIFRRVDAVRKVRMEMQINPTRLGGLRVHG